MFKNIIVSAFRSLLHYRWLSALNLIGLTIGLTTFLLLTQYVVWERSFDQFHFNSNDIYRVDFLYYRNPGELTLHSGSTFGKVGPTLTKEFPEIIASVRIHSKQNAILEVNGVKYEETDMYYAENSFFNVFSYEVLEGDPETCLDDIKSAVISERQAKKYFTNRSPIGEKIELKSPDGDESFEITAVVRSPKNSHFQFKFIFPLTALALSQDYNFDNDWNRYSLYTYIRLNPSSKPKSLEEKLPAYLDKYGNERLNSKRIVFALQSMPAIHLDSHLEYEIGENGNRDLTNFLEFIAIFILIIAWINYVNLSTAGSLQRAKEVGIRKTLGAPKGLLRLQFLLEPLIINGAAVVVALFAFWLLLPQLESLINQPLENTFFNSLGFWGFTVIIWFLGSIASGFYPTLVLSRLNPIKALRYESLSRISIRNALVIFQFLVSTLLVSATLIIVFQTKYMSSQELGVTVKNRVGILATNYMSEENRFQQLLKNYKEELLKINGVKQAALSSEVPGESVSWSGGSRRVRSGQTDYQYSLMFKLTVDRDFFKFYETELLAGRFFEKPTDTVYTILNETGLRALDFNTPQEAINQQVYLAGFDTVRIIGVIRDYHQESLANPIAPTALMLFDRNNRYVSIELDGIGYADFMKQARNLFEARFQNAPYIHFLIADNIQSKYAGEQDLLNLITLFSGLAIFIAILGLIGLAFFSVQKRKKEISIRKILGSSKISLFRLLTRDIGYQILIANAIAAPCIYYFANQWLNGFAYRISFPWITLILVVGITLVVSISSVSSLIWKVLKENPVKHLRNE